MEKFIRSVKKSLTPGSFDVLLEAGAYTRNHSPRSLQLSILLYSYVTDASAKYYSATEAKKTVSLFQAGHEIFYELFQIAMEEYSALEKPPLHEPLENVGVEVCFFYCFFIIFYFYFIFSLHFFFFF